MSSGSFQYSILFALAFTCASAFTAEIQVVSRPHSPIPQSTGDSLGLYLGGDSPWAGFSSTANGLVESFPAAGEFRLNVYLKNLQTGAVSLISTNNQGIPANGDSIATGISGDGRFVVFESDAPDLVSGDANEASDIFLFDRVNAALTRISGAVQLENGVEPAEIASAAGASITSDGRYIFFEAEVAGSLYYLRYDRETRSTVPAVVRPDGEPWPDLVGVSPGDNGRFVTFLSPTNLLAAANGDIPQLFLHDILLRTNRWLSMTVTNGPATFVSDARLSPDSSFIAFVASDLRNDPPQTGNRLYLYSTIGGSLVQVPLPSEVPTTLAPQIHAFDLSSEARFVAYTLAHLPTEGTRHLPAQLYLYDRAENANQALTSVPSETAEVQISTDGNSVVFTSQGGNLVPGVANEFSQLYRFERSTGSIRLLSFGAGGNEANSDILGLALNPDATLVAFETMASNLSPNDDPFGNDVFVATISATNNPSLVSAAHPASINSTASGASELPYLRPQISLDGDRILMISSAPDLAPNDPYSDSDLIFAETGFGVTALLGGLTNAANERPFFLDASADLSRVVFAQDRTAYLFDRNSQSVSLAALLPDGTPGEWATYTADLTADGRYLLFRAYESESRDQLSYVRDLETGQTKLIPAAYGGFGTDWTRLSEGGQYVLHQIYVTGGNSPNPRQTLIIDRETGATNSIELVVGATAFDDSVFLATRGTSSDLWVYRPDTQQSTLVSTNSETPVLSADGSIIVYSQRLTNGWQNFIYDVANETTTPLMIGGTGFRFEQDPAVSFDGRFIAFSIEEDQADDPRTRNLYVYDRVLTNVTAITTADGSPIEQVQGVAISADGHTVVFDSSNDELVPRDRNFAVDTFIVRLDAVDTDGDSLEDGWEIVHFGSLQQTADADSDGDGRSNGEELAAGTDPLNAASQFRVVVSAAQNEMVRLEWPSAPGKVYQVQQTSALAKGAWTDLGAPVTATSNHTAAIVPGADLAFYRVSIIP